MKEFLKKNSILKAIGIMFLIYVVLSWIIPGGNFSELTFTKDTTYPLGLGDIITYPLATFFSSNFAGVPFIMIGMIILFIGGLYGVMNKTGAYTKIVDKTVSIFENKKKYFIVLSILLFSILASLTTLSWPLFILVPFMMTVILVLGYDKMTALLSTVGAILVGNMATIYGYNTESLSYFNILFNNEINDLVVVKIVLFVVCIFLLNVFVLYYSKKQEKPVKKNKKNAKNEVKEEQIKLYIKEATTDKSGMPLFIILALLVIVSLVGMYAWEGAFGIELFNNIHEKITSFEINNYAIFADIIGTSNRYLGWTIGKWGNCDLIVMLLLASVIIGLVYKLSFKDMVDSFVAGMKEMLKVALLAIIANTIYLVVIVSYNAGETLFIASIVNRLLEITTEMNYFIISGITIVAAPFFNELPYLAATLQQPLLSAYENYPLLTIIMQSVYGLMMMILPTSVVLVAGISYADVSIKEYFKHSWKLLLGLFIAITVVILLFMYCPGIKVL